MNPLRLACCCLLLVVCVAPAAAQRIASLEILTRTDELGRGPELDHGVLSRLIEARAGIRYTPAMASRDLARFVATGLFSAERSDYWVEPVERGVRLTYALQANPVVSGYEFGRVSGIDQDVLERAASRTYPIGLIFDATKRRYAAEVIRQAFDESDLSADVGLPSVDRTGRVRFPILEHRVRSMETRWIGPPLLSEETLREVLSLDAFGLLRPSALEEGRRRLSASGLLESVDLAVSTPDSLGLVDVRVSLDARSLPAPTSRSAMAFMDPERLPECVVSTKPLGVSVPFDLTPPMGPAESQQRAESDSPQGLLDAVLSFLEMGDYRAASALCDEGVSDRIAAADPWLSARLAAIAGRAVKPLTEERDDLPPLAEARLDFALAEVEVRHLAEALGVLPDHPASMRDLAAVLAGVEPDLVVDSRAYASAMASATDHVLALEDLDEVRAALPLIEELLVSREYLRRLDRRLPSAPAPLPPFASIAVGNERILQALLAWSRAEPDSPGAAYTLGLHALGRAFAAAQDPAASQAAGAIALGGVTEAARLASAELARVQSLAPEGYWPGLWDYRALAELLADPRHSADGGFPELLCHEATVHAEGLLYAAVGPEGLLAGEPKEVRQEAAAGLATRIEGQSRRGAELAVLAHLWVDDLAGAEEALARALLPDHADAPSVRALTGLIALRSGDPAGAIRALSSGAASPDPLLGAALYAAGDQEQAAHAYGLG